MTNKEVKINLIGNEYQARKRRIKTWAMLLAVLVSILAAMIYVHYFYQQRLQVLALENQRLKEEQSQALMLDQEHPNKDYLQLKKNSVQIVQNSQASTLDLLDEIEKTLPTAIALSEIIIEWDRVTVKGYSSVHTLEAVWLGGLKEQQLLQELMLLDSQWNESREEFGFELVLARRENQQGLK